MGLFSDCQAVCAVVDTRVMQPVDNEIVLLLILAEDRRFFQHPGVDFRSIARAIVSTALKTAFSGASTIEMQLVRTVTGRRELSLIRKTREMIVAMCVAARRSKLEVAATYLDIAYFGTGLKGVDATARHLFRLEVGRCSIIQKAVIISALKRPIPKHKTKQWYRKLFARSRRLLADFDLIAPSNPSYLGCGRRS
jgi:membrane peptidoglycan carboxypeptidase